MKRSAIRRQILLAIPMLTLLDGVTAVTTAASAGTRPGCGSRATFIEFPLPTMGRAPLGLTIGPDGNVWFTEYGTARIGRITRPGRVTEFSLSARTGPSDIAAGPVFGAGPSGR